MTSIFPSQAGERKGSRGSRAKVTRSMPGWSHQRGMPRNLNGRILHGSVKVFSPLLDQWDRGPKLEHDESSWMLVDCRAFMDHRVTGAVNMCILTHLWERADRWSKFRRQGDAVSREFWPSADRVCEYNSIESTLPPPDIVLCEPILKGDD